MPIDNTPPAPGTVVKPESRDPVAHTTPKPKKPWNCEPGKVDTSRLAEEQPDFDWTLKGSHDRLCRALARRTAQIERQSITGKSADLASEIANAANAWKTLMATQPKADPLDQQPGETDDAYRARLEALK